LPGVVELFEVRRAGEDGQRARSAAGPDGQPPLLRPRPCRVCTRGLLCEVATLGSALSGRLLALEG